MFSLHVALSGGTTLSSGAQLCAHRMARCVLPLASCSANHILLICHPCEVNTAVRNTYSKHIQ